MNILFSIVIITCSILLILAVLVQKSKGGGLASGFSSPNAIFGVKKATDNIEKATWGLAFLIIIFSLSTVALYTRSTSPTKVREIKTETETGAPDMSGDTPTLEFPDSGSATDNDETNE